MTENPVEKISRKLDRYENFLELVFGSLLVFGFLMAVLAIVSELTDFSAGSRFYSPEAVVAFMASFLSLTLLADAFKLSIINFTERQRMKTIFTIAVTGMITNILVNTRLSDNILESVLGTSSFLLLLFVSVAGFLIVDRYGFTDV